MFIKNTLVAYSILLMTSIKKSFEELGKQIGKTGKTICRWLFSSEKYYEILEKLSLKSFKNSKELILIFDDTIIRKIHSQFIEGSGEFYDSKMFRRIKALKLLVAMFTDGKQALPFLSKILFSSELVPNQKTTKLEWMKNVIFQAQKLFPSTRIVIAADGAFASKDFLRWCIENSIAIEVRMRSNCVVTYNNQNVKIRDIKSLQPKGRQKARTISVLWHGLSLFITAHKRFDKHGNATVVFQASTFKAKPIKHVKIYQLRWNIEKMFRTVKQNLGLQECFSRKIEVQENHIAAVFLAYAFLQFERIKNHFPNPETALKAAKRKKGQSLKRYIHRLESLIHVF